MSVELIGDVEVREFNFLLDVPGLRADYQRVDFGALNAPGEVRDVGPDELRAELEQLPCCVLGHDRRTRAIRSTWWWTWRSPRTSAPSPTS